MTFNSRSSSARPGVPSTSRSPLQRMRCAPSTALLFALVLGGGLVGPVGPARAAPPQSTPEAVPAQQQPLPEQQPLPDRPGPEASRADILASDIIADVAERVVPSVVNISATRLAARGDQDTGDQATGGMPDDSPFGPMLEDPIFRYFFGERFFGPDLPRDQHSLGSGVILSADGLVVTNSHVIEGADQVRVTLADGREVDAQVVGSDPRSDLAVLRLQDVPAGLRPLPLGRSGDLRLGQVVLAVGNPFAVGQTVTMGIVSATGRSRMGIVDYEDFIQTDAAINPGNSGGALVNLRGELVGINTAILTRSGGYQGLGFAIPTDMARPIVDSLVTSGKVERGFLGVGIQELDRDLAAGLGLSSTRGALIAEVNPDSAAARAGLARGDVVVTLDGTPVDSAAELRNRIASAGPGTRVTLEILRNGERRTVQAVLDKQEAAAPDQGEDSGGEADQTAGQGALAGIEVQALTPALRRRLEIPDEVTGGVVVSEVAPGSRAAAAGLRPGHLILELDRTPITSPSDFAAAQQRAGELVLLLVRTDQGTRYLALQAQKQQESR